MIDDLKFIFQELIFLPVPDDLKVICVIKNHFHNKLRGCWGVSPGVVVVNAVLGGW